MRSALPRSGSDSLANALFCIILQKPHLSLVIETQRNARGNVSKVRHSPESFFAVIRGIDRVDGGFRPSANERFFIENCAAKAKQEDMYICSLSI